MLTRIYENFLKFIYIYIYIYTHTYIYVKKCIKTLIFHLENK